MTAPHYVLLTDRGVVAVDGEDSRSFLQGLVSNDVRRVASDRAAWAALLTPQGKFLHEFFMIEWEGAVLLGGEAERLADLMRRLAVYKLRSNVTITDRSDDLCVAALFGDGATALAGLPDEAGAAGALAGGIAFVDPRLPAAGMRAVLPRAGAADALAAAGFSPAERAVWERLRIGLGLPDGSRDMQPDKAILLENGFDELHGVDWDKGCYMGQELTARTRYRGLVKKRLVPVTFDGSAPTPGTPVSSGGRDVGEIRSGTEGLALALLRLEALERGEPLSAGDTLLNVEIPDWMTV